MKRVITLLLLSSVWLTSAQAFKGNGDVKGQVGLNLQDGGTGIFLSSDFGIGENMSLRPTATYLLAVNKDASGNILNF
jgi:hypothetical protein